MNTKLIAIIGLVLLIIGVGSAATVLFLSNAATNEVEVKAPFTALMSKDKVDWSDTLTLDPKFGGEMSTFYMKYENLANETIKVNVETTITNTDGITRADFEHPVDGEVGGLYYELYDINGSVVNSGNFNENPYTTETGTEELTICGSTSGIFPVDVLGLTTTIIKIEMYHAPNAYGVYKTTTQVMDV